MTSTEEIWESFHRVDNRAAVTDDNRARLYFAQLGRALGALDRSVEAAANTTTAESRAVDRFVTRLRKTFQALALKYFYVAEGRELKIDASDSGFFHFSTLVELAADARTRAEQLEQLPEPEALKREMLDWIVDRCEHPRHLQRAMFWRLYLQMLEPDALLPTFLPGPLEKVGGPNDSESYFWSFATYDSALNRPFVYLLYFAHDAASGALREDSKALGDLRRVAEQSAAGRLSLLAFSHRLDATLPLFRPRIVKRLIIGPYRSPLFTHEGDELDHAMSAVAEGLPFVLFWDSETLISDRETRVGASWLSKGELRQVFWLSDRLELASRGVSQLERFALVPHWFAQQVSDADLLPGHEVIAIGRDETIHGVD